MANSRSDRPATDPGDAAPARGGARRARLRGIAKGVAAGAALGLAYSFVSRALGST